MRVAFENFTLDTDRRELCRNGEAITVEPQVFDVLAFLVANRERVVTRDDLLAAVWDGRIVSESTLASRVNAARRAVDDNGGAQRLIRTVHGRGFRFLGRISEDTDGRPTDSETPSVPTQEVVFRRTADGVNIATSSVGGGPALLKTPTFINHLELDWQGPIFADFFRRLASRNQLIRYDGRGNGLSDWEVPEISFAAFERDLETVADSLELDRFALLGISQGAALAISYAARHPDRVSRLVLIGGYARGRYRRDDPAEAEKGRAMVSIIRHGWGDEHSEFAKIFGALFMPSGTTEQQQWLANLQRFTTNSENAAAIRAACDDIDVVDLLPEVKAPTLILHCRHDVMQPFDEGRIMARGIPGARFVSLESDGHVPLAGSAAWEAMMAEIETFLDAEAEAPSMA